MMDAETRMKVVELFGEKLRELTIECPACAGMTDDPCYTCHVCWCEGGDGKLTFFEVFRMPQLREEAIIH